MKALQTSKCRLLAKSKRPRTITKWTSTTHKFARTHWYNNISNRSLKTKASTTRTIRSWTKGYLRAWEINLRPKPRIIKPFLINMHLKICTCRRMSSQFMHKGPPINSFMRILNNRRTVKIVKIQKTATKFRSVKQLLKAMSSKKLAPTKVSSRPPDTRNNLEAPTSHLTWSCNPTRKEFKRNKRCKLLAHLLLGNLQPLWGLTKTNFSKRSRQPQSYRMCSVRSEWWATNCFTRHLACPHKFSIRH